MANFKKIFTPQALRNFFRRVFFWRKKEKFKIKDYWQGIKREKKRIANEMDKTLFKN